MQLSSGAGRDRLVGLVPYVGPMAGAVGNSVGALEGL